MRDQRSCCWIIFCGDYDCLLCWCNLRSLIFACMVSILIKAFSISSRSPFCLRISISACKSVSSWRSWVLSLVVSVIPSLVKIVTFWPSIYAMPSETAICASLASKTKVWVSSILRGRNLINHGLMMVMSGIWFGKTVISPIYVGIVIWLLSPTNNCFSGLMMVSCMNVVHEQLKWLFVLYERIWM